MATGPASSGIFGNHFTRMLGGSTATARTAHVMVRTAAPAVSRKLANLRTVLVSYPKLVSGLKLSTKQLEYESNALV
jgi:hypothetical protein